MFDSDLSVVLLALMIFLAATLYASVGHGGASGYLAAMALLGVAPEVMKPAALTLNVLVAGIATFKFYRVGAFSWRLFLPLIATSIPCAFIGGSLQLPGEIYKPLVGVVLIYAAGRSFFTAGNYQALEQPNISLPLLLVCGAAIGLLSGLTGVGGGIFLSPILLMLRWADTKVISGIAAAFIVVNSLAGLAGLVTQGATLPDGIGGWAIAAVLGGWLGAEYGSRKLTRPAIQRLLGVVLLIAGIKMAFAI